MTTVGIMQGRLSPAGARAQAFPVKTWREEFSAASRCGFDAIEWLLTDESLDDNPFWTQHRDIAAMSRQSGVMVTSVLADFVIARGHQAALQWLPRMFDAALGLGARVCVLPYLEQSTWRDADDASRVLDTLAPSIAAAVSAGLTVAIESDWSAAELVAALDRSGASVGVCVDSGNSAAAGRRPADEARTLKTKLVHVHLKDRPVGRSSVMLGEGDAHIPAVLAALHEIRYGGVIVLETPRGDDPQQSAAVNLAFVRQCAGPA